MSSSLCFGSSESQMFFENERAASFVSELTWDEIDLVTGGIDWGAVGSGARNIASGVPMVFAGAGIVGATGGVGFPFGGLVMAGGSAAIIGGAVMIYQGLK